MQFITFFAHKDEKCDAETSFVRIRYEHREKRRSVKILFPTRGFKEDRVTTNTKVVVALFVIVFTA